VTFTATVSPTAATGTVTFSDGTTTLGSATLSSGRALYSTSGLSAGTHSITATYNGNSNYLTSSASPVSQVVKATAPDFSLSASPTSRSVNAGSGTTYTVSITRSGGFTGPVTLSIAGLPTGASGTFSSNPAAGTSSRLSITTSSATPGGTFPLTITGTSSGTPIHTTVVTLTVKARKVR
jgi:hypothetical protein